MLAVRKVTTSAPVRVWASVTYGLLPVATGVIASGRFGTAAAFVLLPLIVAQAGRMVAESGARAGRAAWATGLLAAIAGAFVPLLWVIAVIGAVLAAIVFRTTRRGMLRNLLIAVLTPPVLLLPWSLTLHIAPGSAVPRGGAAAAGNTGLRAARKVVDAAQPGRAGNAALLGHRRPHRGRLRRAVRWPQAQVDHRRLGARPDRTARRRGHQPPGRAAGRRRHRSRSGPVCRSRSRPSGCCSPPRAEQTHSAGCSPG